MKEGDVDVALESEVVESEAKGSLKRGGCAIRFAL